MKQNRYRPNFPGISSLVLKLTPEEIAFIDSECLALGITRGAYFRMLIDSDLEECDSHLRAEAESGVCRPFVIALLVSEGWSLKVSPCCIGYRPGWLLQATNNGRIHRILTDDLPGSYLHLLASIRGQ